ncbi:ATP-binding protein [Magnetospirillum aberrantis]|uniref:histidine kinase n=1 Tax=Magnetospirillum aberrantis SpK TaxID=908842 RepID=A0A7C9QT16_9PROT|nr:PAS domain-containing protein [Magnetospirillum aberrantis SpK]
MTVGRLVFGLVALLVAVIWGCVLRDVHGQYMALRAVEMQQGTNDTADLLLAAAHHMVAERGETAQALTTSVEAAAVEHIKMHRRDGGQGLHAALTLLDNGEDLAAAARDVAKLRLSVDQDMLRPVAERSPQLRQDWLDTTDLFLGRLTTSVRRLTLPSDRTVVFIRRMNRIKLWTLDLYRSVQDQTTQVALARSHDRPLSSAELLALARMRGEADTVWSHIVEETQSLNNRALVETVERTQQALNANYWPMWERMLNGRPPGTERAVANPVEEQMAALMERTRQGAVAAAQTAHAAATRSMVVHGGVALAALGLGAAALALLRRRLLTPLRRLRRDLRSLARRDLDLPMDVRFHHDELGEMRTAILEFRDALEERRSLWNALPDFICFKDDLGRWQWINATAATLFGLEDGDYRDRTDSEVAAAAPHLSAWLLSAAGAEESVRSKGATISREEVIATIGGDVHFFHVLRVPLFRPDHVCRGTIVLGREVTDRRRTEVAMARLAQQNQLLLDCAGEGIIGLDSSGHVTFVNPAVERLTGWDALDLVGHPQHHLMHHRHADGRDYPEHECPIHHTLRDGQTRYCEREVFWNKSGDALPVEFTVTAIQEQDEVRGAVIIFRDIQARLAAEQEIESLLADLRRSNAELERFAYVASHDLRQPLRMITSFLSLVVRRMNDRMGDEEREFIGFAVDGAQRMDRMIQDLLSYSRIGRTDTREEVDLEQVAESVTATLRTACAEAGAEITILTPLPTIWGVRSELERLFQNLLANAIKFRAEERPPRITVMCEDKGDNWSFSIADNGIGIEAKDHDRLFNIFQRLVPQSQYEGTGIGLASCRKIVEHHQGRIWVTSVPGEGSTFSFTLPKKTGVAE